MVDVAFWHFLKYNSVIQVYMSVLQLTVEYTTTITCWIVVVEFFKPNGALIT